MNNMFNCAFKFLKSKSYIYFNNIKQKSNSEMNCFCLAIGEMTGRCSNRLFVDNFQ